MRSDLSKGFAILWFAGFIILGLFFLVFGIREIIPLPETLLAGLRETRFLHYMGGAWLSLGTSGFGAASLKEDPASRKTAMESAANMMGIGIGHFLAIAMLSFM